MSGDSGSESGILMLRVPISWDLALANLKVFEIFKQVGRWLFFTGGGKIVACGSCQGITDCAKLLRVSNSCGMVVPLQTLSDKTTSVMLMKACACIWMAFMI
jgi:hypothetical protein